MAFLPVNQAVHRIPGSWTCGKPPWQDGTLFVFDVKRKDRNVSKRDKETGPGSPDLRMCLHMIDVGHLF